MRLFLSFLLVAAASLLAGCGSFLDAVRAEPDMGQVPAIEGEWELVARDAFRGTRITYADDDGQLGAEGAPRVRARHDCRYDSAGVGWGFLDDEEPWIVARGTGRCEGWYAIGAFFNFTGQPIGWVSGYFLDLDGPTPPPEPLPPHDGRAHPFDSRVFSQECGEILHEHAFHVEGLNAGGPREPVQLMEDLIAQVCDFGRTRSTSQ